MSPIQAYNQAASAPWARIGKVDFRAAGQHESSSSAKKPRIRTDQIDIRRHSVQHLRILNKLAYRK